MQAGSIKFTLIATVMIAVTAGLCTDTEARRKNHAPDSTDNDDGKDKSEKSKCEKCIEIDHSRYGRENMTAGKVWEVYRSLALSPGDVFRIIIENTYPGLYDYSIAGIESPPPEESELNFVDGVPQRQSYEMIHSHNPKYGGYIVEITARDKDKAPFGDVKIIISVKTLEWKIGFAGGFTGSTLTASKYGIVTDNTGDMHVVRDVDSEDKVRLGIASFVHLWHSSADWFAWSFGLGLESGSNIVYYTGPSYRFGDKGALTVGLSVGSVPTLPAGTGENTVVTDPNILSDLPTKNRLAFFVGISYSFIGGSEAALSKPFEGQD